MAKGTSCTVHLLGNLGSDPKMEYGQSGTARARLSVATTEVRKDKDGNQVDITHWHNVTFFGKAAEVIGEYMRKGGKILVIGTIRYRTDEASGKRYTDIIGNEFTMLNDGRNGAGGDADNGNRQQRQNQQPAQQPAPQPAQQSAPQQSDESAPPMDDFADDDLPF